MVIQDKNKYNTPKYRLVVRKTCSKIICQIIFSTLIGDKVICEASSQEFKKYGLTTGTTSYAAAYATGLLLARRLLKQLNLDSIYKGADKVSGEEYDVNGHVNEDKSPFKAVLDIGITAATTGNKVFGALKGALDGGLNIPHSTKRYPGFKEDKYDAKVHRERIFGVHIDKYMKELKKESEDAYKKQFNLWE